MRRVKNTRTGKHYDLPTELHEVTLAEWMRIVAVVIDEGDEVDATAALLDIPRSECVDIVAHGYTLMHIDPESLASAIATGKPKSTLTIFGEACDVPKSWDACTFGQRAMLMPRIADKKFYETADAVLAVCLAPNVYGEHWSDHIDTLIEEVRELPAVEAVPTASFFLAGLLSTKMPGKGRLRSLLIRIGSQLGARSFPASVFLTYGALSLAQTMKDLNQSLNMKTASA